MPTDAPPVDRLLDIAVGEGRVSGLFRLPQEATALLVLAHGAGAGMRHRFMAAVADGFADRGVATLRFQFPYMEAGGRRPDPPARATAAIRAAVAAATREAPDLPLFAGGKSFGGRMTSTAEAETHLEPVRGLVFFGFPLHPAGKPGLSRADHLDRVSRPMLFLQGTKDRLAEMGLIEQLVARLDARATLVSFAAADHSFHVPKASGRSDEEVMAAMLDVTAEWMSTRSG